VREEVERRGQLTAAPTLGQHGVGELLDHGRERRGLDRDAVDHGTVRRRVRALRGIAKDGARVLALVSPLYLRFVDVLFCRYTADEGFVWVRHDALLDEDDAPAHGAVVDGVAVEATPLTPVIEELAHAVLAQRRSGRELPPALHLFAHLFDARIDDDPPL